MSQLKVNSIVPTGGLPAGAAGGGIIQTVTASSKTTYSFTSSSYTDTDIQVNITPSSASSKVLVSCTLVSMCYATNSTSLGIQLVRDSTAVWNANEYHWHSVNAAVAITYSSFFQFLDTPNTTSQTLYKIQGARYRTSNGTQQAKLNQIPSNTSHGCIIVAQEVTG